MPIEAMFFLISIIGTFGFILYTYFNTRHKERMAIIDKGGDITYPSNSPNAFGSLKWGTILLCIGVGLSVGIAIDINQNHDGPFFTIPLIIIGAGLGQLLYYRLRMNQED